MKNHEKAKQIQLAINKVVEARVIMNAALGETSLFMEDISENFHALLYGMSAFDNTLTNVYSHFNKLDEEERCRSLES